MKDLRPCSKKNRAWAGGKGSLTRASSDAKKYADNWDRIFGKKEQPDAGKEKEA